ncbi:MAG: ATP-binding protein [Halieaceae bacterium]
MGQVESSVSTAELPETLSSQQLEQAFAAFNRVSDELGSAWGELEQRVAHLSSELAAARSARLAELAAKEALAEQLSTLMDALPGGVVVIDSENSIDDCNPAAEIILGVPLKGRHWDELVTATGSTLPAHDGEFDSHDGRRLALAYSELGSADARIALITDISENHRLRQLLHREQRLRELGDMAARLAHQLRTPLSSAMLYLSQLDRVDNDNDESARVGGKVRERLHQIERLIEGMLRFIRGADDPVQELCLGQLLRANCEAMSPQLELADAELELTLPVQGLQFSGQRELLENAISNLLDNALQSCPEHARIEVRLEQSDTAILISVGDNGPGVDTALEQRIFEPWFSTRAHGTGLGLAVVASAASAHGGSVAVETSALGGSEFTLRLPLAADKE